MASTLKLGNGNWGVKEDSLLAYSDKNNNFLPLPFDFSRASSATVVNKAGLIETVQSGEPRIDFSDSVDGALLLEPQRSNLLTYSEDFNDASWIKSRASITDNSLISPDGTLNADKLIPNTYNTANHYIRKTASIINLTDYSYSFFAKKGEYNFVSTYVSALGGAYSWDLENGVVIAGINAFIENYGNGWYRCGLNATSSSTSLSCRIYANKYSDRNTSFQGDGTSGVYIYGAQLEQGSYATSYIPTQGSSSTRIAEICNNSGSAQDFNDSEGVLYGEFSTNNTDSPNWLNISDTSAVNWLFLGKQDGYIRVYLRANDSVILDYTKPLEDKNKIALSYKSGDIKVYINGVNVDNSTNTFSFTSALSRIDFNQYSGGGTQTQIAWKAITVFNTALTDEELIELTKI
jgi:hypothetical protein